MPTLILGKNIDSFPVENRPKPLDLDVHTLFAIYFAAMLSKTCHDVFISDTNLVDY